MQFTTVALAALLGLASAQKVHVVSVGSTNGSLVFSPNNMKAAAGDMVQFQFRAGNHSVVQSNFDKPCMPISMSTPNTTGMFSGYMPVAASEAMGMIPTYTMMVADTKPMWFYCSQAKHCQAGMVMVINENTAANASRSLSAFQGLAKAATANIAPSGTTSQAGTSGTSGSGSSGNSGNSGSSGSSGSTGGTGSTGSTTGSGTGSGTGSTSSGAGVPATGSASTVAFSSTLGLLSLAAAALSAL